MRKGGSGYDSQKISFQYTSFSIYHACYQAGNLLAYVDVQFVFVASVSVTVLLSYGHVRRCGRTAVVLFVVRLYSLPLKPHLIFYLHRVLLDNGRFNFSIASLSAYLRSLRICIAWTSREAAVRPVLGATVVPFKSTTICPSILMYIYLPSQIYDLWSVLRSRYRRSRPMHLWWADFWHSGKHPGVVTDGSLRLRPTSVVRTVCCCRRFCDYVRNSRPNILPTQINAYFFRICLQLQYISLIYGISPPTVMFCRLKPDSY